nr:reductive dehalogenase [uncultured prokaryote]
MVETSNEVPYVVDSDTLRRFDQRRTVFGRRLGDPEAPFYRQHPHEGAVIKIMADEPGYSHLDYARSVAAWTVAEHFHGAYAWDRLGDEDPVLRRFGQYPVTDRDAMCYEIKQTARLYGASLVGVCELDRRWVYASDMRGNPIEIPAAYRHAIVIAVAMDVPAIKTAPAYPASAATGVGYSRMAFLASSLAQFIRHLGYRAIAMGNDTALSIPLAIDAGLGELGRNGLLITPEYGSCVRLCKVFTDLPLVSDKPKGFGLGEICRRCRVCAEMCEVGAISSAPAPSFAVTCPSNNVGIQRWAVNHDRCYTFWLENGSGCSTCIAACPFTGRRGAV